MSEPRDNAKVAVRGERATMMRSAPGRTRIRYARGMVAAVLCAAIGVAQAHLPYSTTLLTYVAHRWGKAASQRVFEWRGQLANAWTGADELERVHAVHRFWNGLPYVDDDTNWRSADYWATPAEMLAVNGGDCEDYATAKYFSLRELGIDARKLRLTYLMVGDREAGHLVLAYYASADAPPLILDNRREEPYRRDAEPGQDVVFSFNEDHLWIGDVSAPSGSVVQLGKWRQLLERVGRERAA